MCHILAAAAVFAFAAAVVVVVVVVGLHRADDGNYLDYSVLSP